MSMTTQQKLEDAETQLHLLNTGQKVHVSVDINGERVEFNRVNIGRLERYVENLKSQLGTADYSNRKPFRMSM